MHSSTNGTRLCKSPPPVRTMSPPLTNGYPLPADRVARELQSVKLLLVDSVQRNAAYLQAQVQSLQSMLKGVAATK